MRHTFSCRCVAWLVAASLGVAVAAPSANAAEIDAVDLDGLDLEGMNLVAEVEHDFLSAVHQSDVGDIRTEVYEDNGLFTYTYEVTPNPHFWHQVSTPGLIGFNNVAGYSFGQAEAAELEFNITTDEASNIVAWTVPGAPEETSPWRRGETVTFFYQSNAGPGPLAVFSSAWNENSSAAALGVVPIPEPASASLLALMGLAMLRRRRRRRA